ncbi:MAG TPA: ABC transporter permease [Candidatus Methylomirabilis sp.]|nr:ABC transporter permease [Candidatus Methylomirabilis sp.]
MRLARLLAVARKEVIQIRRDPRSLGMAFVIPMIFLFLFGYALTLDVDNLKTIVYDQDRTAVSRDFLARFEESGYFSVAAVASSYGDVEWALDSGKAQVGLVIPRNFARDLDLGRQVPVQALLDGSDSNTATLAISYLKAISRRYSDQLVLRQAGLDRRDPPVENRLRVWYNPELQSKNYIVPGLIAVIMMVIAALLTSLTIAREWERGTMEQLIATPIRVPELVLGKLLPYFGIGVIDVMLAALAGTLVFRVPFRGSVVLFLGFSLIFLLGALSLGMLISIKAKSQLVASQVAMVVTFLPSFLLSGFMYDIGNMPGWLQAITHVFPARYFVTILKGIFLKGIGYRVLGMEAGFLALFALIVTAAANRKFRKNLE